MKIILIIIGISLLISLGYYFNTVGSKSSLTKEEILNATYSFTPYNYSTGQRFSPLEIKFSPPGDSQLRKNSDQLTSIYALDNNGKLIKEDQLSAGFLGGVWIKTYKIESRSRAKVLVVGNYGEYGRDCLIFSVKKIRDLVITEELSSKRIKKGNCELN
jgi:hypothetical protein